ncbi:unnamed protein product, partial [Prorocentrum cordatum]
MGGKRNPASAARGQAPKRPRGPPTAVNGGSGSAAASRVSAALSAAAGAAPPQPRPRTNAAVDPGVPSSCCCFCLGSLESGGPAHGDEAHERCYKTWEIGYSHLEMSACALKCRTEDAFYRSFKKSNGVLRDNAQLSFYPGTVSQGVTSSQVVPRTFGAFSRSEFFDHWKYMPEQVGIKCRTLWDEWGAEYAGVLTLEIAGAPRIFTMEHRKSLNRDEHSLQVANCIHKDQPVETFNVMQQQVAADVGPTGAKALSMAEITRRCDAKKVPKSSAAEDPQRVAAEVADTGASDVVEPSAPTILGGCHRVASVRNAVCTRRARMIADSPVVARLPSGSAVGAGSPNVASLSLESPLAVGSAVPPPGSVIGPRDSVSQIGDDIPMGVCPKMEPPSKEMLEHDPFKYKWEAQVFKLRTSSVLNGRTSYGRERRTAEIYHEEATKVGRSGLATTLRDQIDFNEKCEMAAKGDILTMDSAALAALCTEINNKQPPMFYTTKFLLVVRALKDWKVEAVTKGIEALFDKFWDIQSPSKLEVDSEEHIEFDAMQPRLRAVGGSVAERCSKMLDNLYDCVLCPLIADGKNSLPVLVAICKKLVLQVDEVMECQANGELEDWGDTVVNVCRALVGIAVEDAKLTRESWLAVEALDRSGSSIFASIRASPFYRDALATYRRVPPATKRLGGPIATAEADLKSLPEELTHVNIVVIEKAMAQLKEAKGQQLRMGEYFHLEKEL